MRAPKGQNFIHQETWLRKVAAAVGPSRALVEIGGGPGGLTALLAEQSERLWVIEQDARLAEQLRRRFGGVSHVTVIEADVLRVDLGALASEAGEKLRVAGNLPYYITSPILLALFRQAMHIRDATLMVQKEYAERMLASPGGREFGLLAATTQFYARAERRFDLPPGAFRPAPKVHSTLLRLEITPRSEALGVDERGFVEFLRRAFQHKRKQLANVLGADAAAAAGVGATARAETLTLEQWAAVYRAAARKPVE
jgi:16S rRNA (adenine1518-N6/adenine1519-N6)-dimethyltransferase